MDLSAHFITLSWTGGDSGSGAQRQLRVLWVLALGELTASIGISSDKNCDTFILDNMSIFRMAVRFARGAHIWADSYYKQVRPRYRGRKYKNYSIFGPGHPCTMIKIRILSCA